MEIICCLHLGVIVDLATSHTRVVTIGRGLLDDVSEIAQIKRAIEKKVNNLVKI